MPNDFGKNLSDILADMESGVSYVNARITQIATKEGSKSNIDEVMKNSGKTNALIKDTVLLHPRVFETERLAEMAQKDPVFREDYERLEQLKERVCRV